MTLEQFAALAEIIASVGVILSLIFVGFQVRESNREARASAIQDAMNLEIETTSIFAENYETWDKIIKGEPLEGREQRKAILLYNVLMTETENRYLQYKEGYLPRQTWEGRQNVLRKTVSMPIFPLWRQANSGQNHARDFLALVDSLHADPLEGKTP